MSEDAPEIAAPSTVGRSRIGLRVLRNKANAAIKAAAAQWFDTLQKDVDSLKKSTLKNVQFRGRDLNPHGCLAHRILNCVGGFGSRCVRLPNRATTRFSVARREGIAHGSAIARSRSSAST